jgi:hypothetical protein
MPKLSAISELFSRPATFASLWLHVMLINLFVGKSVYQEGRQQQVFYGTYITSSALGTLVAVPFKHCMLCDKVTILHQGILAFRLGCSSLLCA